MFAIFSRVVIGASIVWLAGALVVLLAPFAIAAYIELN